MEHFRMSSLPLVTPGQYNKTQEKDFLAHLNKIRSQQAEDLNGVIQSYVMAVQPYRAGHVLEVDTSFVGRKRLYYKGAKRFLIQHTESFFWTRSQDGPYHNMFINLHGFYLAEDGSVLLPPLTSGLPTELDPAMATMEKISLNTSGFNATILGLSVNQEHKWADVQAIIDVKEAEQQVQEAGLKERLRRELREG